METEDSTGIWTWGLLLCLPCKRKEKRILTSVLYVVSKNPLWRFLKTILKGLSSFAIALGIKLVAKRNTMLGWSLKHLGLI